MIYADRLSHYTPLASTKDQFVEDTNLCHYFYVASYTRGPYTLLYPRDFLAEGEIVLIDRAEDTDEQWL